MIGGGPSALSICAFWSMLNVLFSVVVFHRFMVELEGVLLILVFVLSAICETYVVYWYSIYLWSIAVGGTSAISICAFCYM